MRPRQSGKSMMGNAAVIAFSCKPSFGSEWGVGWNYVRMLAQIFDKVELFVRDAELQVEEIGRGLVEGGIGNVNIVPIPDMRIYRLIRQPRYHGRFLTLYYFLWLWRVFLLLGRQRAWRRCDYLFHVTWVSDWIFSPFFLLPFRRKILGPIGSQTVNFNRQSHDRFRSRLRVGAKTLARVGSPNILNALRVDGVIGITNSVLDRFPWRYARNRTVITPVFCELMPAKVRSPDKVVLFIGKHLAFKNLDLFLQTAYKLIEKDPAIAVHVFGDPVGTTLASDFVATGGLQSRIIMHGVVPQAEVGRYLSGHLTILLQTSSECGGTAGVEAASLGAPVVCASGYGLDAFFPAGAYPYSVIYRDGAQFVEDASELLVRIFTDYDTHSTRISKLAKRFSFDGSVEVLRGMIAATEKAHAKGAMGGAQ